MKDDRVYVEHILECLERIEAYTAAGREAFFAQPLISDAVVRNLQVMAESAKRVSPELQARNAAVPWRALAGFRNVLVHDYLGLDLDRIWAVVEQDLPPLHEQVARLAREIRID